jgi:hypothetical protein
MKKNFREKTVVINNKTYHYSKIVMLQSNSLATDIHIHKESNGSLVLLHHTVCSKNPQHLYFLSPDKICVGDWVIEYQKGDFIGEVHFINSEYKIAQNIQYKIIASTDNSLNLPKPSNLFLQVYINAFNIGEKIEECLVQMEEVYQPYYENNEFHKNATKYQFKITKREITIKKVKGSWNRKEILTDIESAIIKGLTLAEYRDTWIQ